MSLDTRVKEMYHLRVGISTVFEILVQFLFEEGRDHPYAHNLYKIRCSLTEEIIICTV
jgi:hypothetical protein